MRIKNLRYYIAASWISLGMHFSAFSVDELTEQLHGMDLNHQCNRWTHFPQYGNTLYITDGTHISTSKKQGAKREYDIVDIPLKDFFCKLNHGLYFGDYGGSSNHLFVTLRIAVTSSNQKNVLWKKYVLCWDESQKKFTYHAAENLPANACFVDFYNKTPQNWVNNKPIIVKGRKVKFVSNSTQGIQGVVAENSTHSEPGALGFLEARKDLVLDIVQSLNPSYKLKFFQIGLHSFLDFCKDCNPMVHTFQENFQASLLSYLKSKLPKQHSLRARIQDKASHILFLLSGINNRLYFKKTYYFYENGAERNHRFSGYFLQQYQPFTGELPWKKREKTTSRLITYINEPVAQPDCIEALPNSLRLMMPLNQATFYWSMAAHSLYSDVGDVVKLFTPNLVMVDLTSARLGINEYEDDGDSWSASGGDELIQVLKSMSACRDMQHLNLSGNNIVQDKVVSQLPAFFAPFTKLTFLSLAHALPHNQTALNFVGQSLGVLDSLTYLDLSNNSLNSDMFGSLTEWIDCLFELKTLDLSGNRLSGGYEDYKGIAEEDTIETLGWVCNFIHATPTLIEVDITDNNFDGIGFYWSEIEDYTGLSKEELKAVYKKISIEEDAGGAFSESDESTSETSSVVSSEADEEDF